MDLRADTITTARTYLFRLPSAFGPQPGTVSTVMPTNLASLSPIGHTDILMTVSGSYFHWSQKEELFACFILLYLGITE
jgi:hypothetical protein